MATRVVRRRGKRITSPRKTTKAKQNAKAATKVRTTLRRVGQETRAVVDRATEEIKAGARKAIRTIKENKKTAAATAAGLAAVTLGVVAGARRKHK
jgi:hypothetical protein